MEKKKNIIIIILLLVLTFLAYLAYSFSKQLNEVKTNTNNYQENNNNEENKKEEEKIEGPHVLSDINLKNDISKKASIILTMGLSDSKEEVVTSTPVWNYKIADLTDKDKFDTTLNYNIKNANKLTISDLKLKLPNLYKKYKKYDESDDSIMKSMEHEDAKIISGEVIENSHKELFDANIPNFNDDDHLGYCPTFEYDKQTNYYLIRNNCSGIAYPTYFIYKNKYIIDSDTISVDAYVAIKINKGINKIYKGLEEKDSNYLYTEKDDNVIKNDLKAYPEKYQIYRLIFEKNEEGTYSYKITQKID